MMHDDYRQASLLDCLTGRLLECSNKKGGLVGQSPAATAKKMREHAEAEQTAETKISETLLPLVCTCRSFQFPHGLESHAELQSEHDWRTWQQREAEGGRSMTTPPLGTRSKPEQSGRHVMRALMMTISKYGAEWPGRLWSVEYHDKLGASGPLGARSGTAVKHPKPPHQSLKRKLALWPVGKPRARA